MKITESLVFQLLKLTFSIYLFVTFILTGIHMYSEWGRTEGLILDELKGVADSIDSSISMAMWEVNYEQVDLILKGVQVAKVVTGVKIEEKNHTNSYGLSGNIQFSKPLYFEEDGIRNNTGVLTIYSNSSIVLNRVKGGYLLIAINAVVKTIALWIIVLFVGKRLITKPLEALTRVNHRLNLENLAEIKDLVRTSTGKKNELSLLHESFYAMTEKLMLTKDKLDAERLELDQEVKARKVELERKQEELKHAEDYSRLILDSVGEGMFGVDNTGLINFVNPSAAKILGYREGEMLGQKAHSLIHHTHPDGTEYDVKDCPMFHSFTEGVSEKILDEILWCKDGSSIQVEYSSTPIQKGDQLLGAVITFLDVSERSSAAEKIRKSEDLLSRALKLANMGGWEYNVGKQVYWTQEVYEIHGIEPGMVEKEPERDWISESINCYQGEDQKRIEDAFNQALTNGTPYDLIMRFKPWNREEIWIRTTGEPILENGKVVRVIGLFSDVDKQQKLEKALIAEKTHLEKVLDSSPVGVAISVDGVMQFANPKIMEMFDLKVGDPSPQFYVNSEDRDHVLDTLKQYGIIEGYELQMFGRDQTIKEMLVTYMTIPFEGETGILGWVMDITDLKKRDQELRQKFDELSRFQKLAVGRELKMIEMKKEINEMLAQSGHTPKYKITETEKTK